MLYLRKDNKIVPEKKIIQEMFDSIAPGYDAFNHVTSLGIDRRWRRKALKHIEGPKVLDIACGTGDFAITIAEKKGFEVVGADISAGMLEIMRGKVEKAGLQDRVTAVEGDCAALDFPDGSFDSVTVAFGVRNFEDRPRCLAEILRVLRPGGRFVMLELGVPKSRAVAAFYKFYFTRIMPLVGRKMSGNRGAYEYLPASVLRFPGPEEWMPVMENAGFRDVRHRALSLGICRMYTGRKAL